MVPDAMRSPGRALQPVLVWCASCCFIVQYMNLKFDLQISDSLTILIYDPFLINSSPSLFVDLLCSALHYSVSKFHLLHSFLLHHELGYSSWPIIFSCFPSKNRNYCIWGRFSISTHYCTVPFSEKIMDFGEFVRTFFLNDIAIFNVFDYSNR